MVIFEMRGPESPYIDRIWRSYSVGAGDFTSVAANHLEMVVTKVDGKIDLTVRGPETHASAANYPSEGEWVGIRFRLGVFLTLPFLQTRRLVDGDVQLPDAAGKSFWLDSAAWEFPTYDNAEVFVKRLVRDGLLRCEPVVQAMTRGEVSELSLRSTQRRFLQATGITHAAARQIARARRATLMLQQGRTVLDTVYENGYFDQPHLTRSLKHFIGQTPAQLARNSDELSLLYPPDEFLPGDEYSTGFMPPERGLAREAG